jgi:cytochrome P450
MEAAEGDEIGTRQLVSRILMVNFAAIHTTTIVRYIYALLTDQAFTHAIYDLASRPEYVSPLREEIEPLILEHGWQKSTLMKMKKLDSFVKEILRLNLVSGGKSVSTSVDNSGNIQESDATVYLLQWNNSLARGNTGFSGGSSSSR